MVAGDTRGRRRESPGATHLLVVALNGSSEIDLDRHIDHGTHRVTYIADGTRAGTVRAYQGVTDMVVVSDPTDVDGEVFSAVAELFRRNGPADAVFTPSEYDLLTAARVRDEFDVDGMREPQMLFFRDKVRMKERVAASGLAVPRFAGCDDPDRVRRLIARIGYPVVLKPRRGMGSRGIHVIHDEAGLDLAWRLVEPDVYEVEEFVFGPIYHVDGLVHDDRMVFDKVSGYVNTCLETAQNGIPLGSVVVDDDPLRRCLRDFAASCLAALALRNGPFHLEIVLRDDRQPVFLEAGARPGGGQIRMVFEDVYGIDLTREWAKLEMRQQPDIPAPDDRIAGWLVVPPPCPPPYQVVACPPVGDVPGLYYSMRPATGDVYDEARLGQDRWAGGQFRFCGSTSAEVTAAIRRTTESYRLDVRPPAGHGVH